MTNWHPTEAQPTQYGLSRQELEENKTCQREHRNSWVVTMREHNRSAFNGYHRTPSDWSEVICGFCGRRWRTKADYVRQLPDEGEQ